MNNDSIDLGDYEVTAWLRETGWPTMENDIHEMIHIYHEWQQTKNMHKDATYQEDILIQMISTRMRHIHPNSRDASVISAMLIIHAAYLARTDGVPSPGLIRRLH